MSEMFLPDDAATLALGETLARRLRAGDIVLLSGDLGAGKTALARAMIRTLMGDAELDVPSPSFALVQPYEGKGVAVLHADLHRLAHAAEIAELGLLEAEDAIVIVEWPERAPELTDKAALIVTLSVPDDGIGRRANVIARRDGL